MCSGWWGCPPSPCGRCPLRLGTNCGASREGSAQLIPPGTSAARPSVLFHFLSRKISARASSLSRTSSVGAGRRVASNKRGHVGGSDNGPGTQQTGSKPTTAQLWARRALVLIWDGHRLSLSHGEDTRTRPCWVSPVLTTWGRVQAGREGQTWPGAELEGKVPLPRWWALGLKGAAGGLVPGKIRPPLIREGPAPGRAPGWPRLPATTGETQASAGPGFSSILSSCPWQRESVWREVTQRQKDARRSARTGGPQPHDEVMQEPRPRVQSGGWRRPGPPGPHSSPCGGAGRGGDAHPGRGPRRRW